MTDNNGKKYIRANISYLITMISVIVTGVIVAIITSGFRSSTDFEKNTTKDVKELQIEQTSVCNRLSHTEKDIDNLQEDKVSQDLFDAFREETRDNFGDVKVTLHEIKELLKIKK